MKHLTSFLLLASIAIGCTKPDTNDPDNGNSSAGENVRVTITNADGSENQLLEWRESAVWQVLI